MLLISISNLLYNIVKYNFYNIMSKIDIVNVVSRWLLARLSIDLQYFVIKTSL